MARADRQRILFTSRNADRVRGALRDSESGRLLEPIGIQLQLALRGSDEAACEYVRDYRQLTASLLREVHHIQPDRVLLTHAGEVALVGANGEPARAPIEAIETAAAEAPFTPWAARYDLADAVGLDLINHLRGLLGHRALSPPVDSRGWVIPGDDLMAQRFIHRVRKHLNHSDARHPLNRIMDAFGLSKTGLAGLFGVRRQAVDQWLARGVPPERQDKVATVEALVDLLDRKLKPDRLPGVARRPAAAYGGETMLDMIRQDRHAELLEIVRDSFDWATAA